MMDPHLRHLIWGGTRLSHLLGHEPGEDGALAETLEVSDLPGMPSRIRGTDLTLRELIQSEPGAMFGDEMPGLTAFPVLVKRLDVGDWLSVQVHPDNESAQRLDGYPFGKEEAWVVLEAREGAEILLGFKEGITSADVSKALASENLPDLMRRIPVVAGDVIPVPPGCIHAIGPGVLIFEVQQSSDLTYRLFDWNRREADGSSRELHLEKGLEVLDPGQRPDKSQGGEGHPIRPLCQMDTFRIERWFVESEMVRDTTRPLVMHCCGGEALLRSGNEEIAVAPGDTVLLPACAGSVAVEPGETCDILAVTPQPVV